MKCKDIELLIIDSSEKDLTEEELSQIEQHISQCEQCQRFEEDLKNIRISLKKIRMPAPSSELTRKTLALCHSELNTRHPMDGKAIPQIRSAQIPLLIWVAFVSLTALTVILALPLLRGLQLTQTLSLPIVVVLAIMIQNAVMLCFAPLLLRKFGSKNQGLRLSLTENNAF
jgi:hypothetical protein